ncbi:MAG: mannitol dehydrogenase family protein [Actinomycetes bacterium]
MRELERTGPRPPVRVVHLGLGNFFRAHQAWYTANAPDAADWGIAGFTGRSPKLALDLAAQDGLYTLVTRAEDGDRFDVLSSVVRTHPADDHEAWLRYLADPEVRVVTLTVTEAGYVRGPDGGLDVDRAEVRADVDTLRKDPAALVRTTPGRLVAGLMARREAGGGPVAVVSCDNLPENGQVAGRVVRDLAAALDDDLARWVDDNVSFVTTMVDRITPRTTEEDTRSVAEATGVHDRAPVVTEPFSEWVISGSFPGGRPRWDEAGATITDELQPYEERKLWLLNGSHSLLAYAGSARGHETVAEAIGDPLCERWVQDWWDEASRSLPQPEDQVAAYRQALLERFSNTRMRHLLAQIAADGSQKLPIRILPVLRRQRDGGQGFSGAARVLAAWVLHLRGAGAPVVDPQADTFTSLAKGELDDAVPKVLTALGGPDLAEEDVVQAVLVAARELERA